MSETDVQKTRTMPKLDGIATFVAIAEAGSLSEAARRLRLSKSVVSDRLAELERGLGASLLHRSARRLTLTEDGTAFLARATRIAREVEEAVANIAERRGALVGPLRISAPVTFGRMHLGPAIYPFLAKHPEIELTLDLDDRRVHAASESYDAVLRHGPIADSRLIAWTAKTSTVARVGPRFLPWRLSDAGPRARHHRRDRAGIRNPTKDRTLVPRLEPNIHVPPSDARWRP